MEKKEILEIERGIRTIKCCYFNKPLVFGFLTAFICTWGLALIGARTLNPAKVDMGGVFLCFPVLFFLFWRLSFYFYFCRKSQNMVKSLKKGAKTKESLNVLRIFCFTEGGKIGSFLEREFSN